jgi:hypothetical protein
MYLTAQSSIWHPVEKRLIRQKKNLKEVILINLEEAQKMGTLDRLLQEAGFDKTQSILALRKELVGFTPIEVAL